MLPVLGGICGANKMISNINNNALKIGVIYFGNW
jgi:hypothetical protein